MPSLFLFNLKKGLKKKTTWKYQQRIYRAFNNYVVKGIEYQAKICPAKFLDKSALLITKTYVSLAQKFFKSILDYADVVEINVRKLSMLNKESKWQ